MKNFHVKFIREFEVDVQADTTEVAGQLAKQIIAQFPAGTCKLLSVVEDGYVEPPEAANTADLNERRNAGLALKVREITGQREPDVA